MANLLFSVNRAVGFNTLRSQFEKHIFFSPDKVGYIIFSDTLENVTAEVADSYVAQGYHVGFLTDTSDEAHAYAVPNASFRAYLRSLATPINNLQKMINAAAIYIASNIGLSGDIRGFGLNYFVSITRYLVIINNPGITGSIPVEICNLDLTASDSSLRLYGSSFNGSIPHEIGNLINITDIRIFNSGLSGLLPFSIFNLTKLTYLSLYSNALTGSLPPQIGNLTNLKELKLANNQLSGIIPSELASCVALTSLELHVNNFTGYEAGAISTGMTALKGVYMMTQMGSSTSTGLPSTAVDQVIIDVADCVLVNNTLNGVVNVSQNFPATAASISDAIARFGGISAKAFLLSKGWAVTHS